MTKEPVKRIKVLLAEDHRIVREGLRKLLEIEPDIVVIGEAKNGRQAILQTEQLHPDVVVMDIAMSELNGLEAMRQIRVVAPETKVLVLSAHSDAAYVEQSLAFGAAGYLLKQTSASNLSKAIREIAKGKTFFSPAITKRLQHKNQLALDRNGIPKEKATRLSPREVEVLQLIAEGFANKQMATELAISIKTVEKHRQHVMEKLDLHDTASLTRYAIENGIIESSIQVTII